MPSVGSEVRPQSKIFEALQWWFPGKEYRAESRFFVESGSSFDMTLADTFDIAPAATEALLVARVNLIVVDTAGAWSNTTFGGSTAYGAGLDNGPRLSVRKGGAQVHEFTADVPIENNADLIMNTGPDFVVTDLGSNVIMAVATWDLVGSHAPVLLEDTDDVIRFVTGASIGVTEMRARADCFVVTGSE